MTTKKHGHFTSNSVMFLIMNVKVTHYTSPKFKKNTYSSSRNCIDMIKPSTNAKARQINIKPLKAQTLKNNKQGTNSNKQQQRTKKTTANKRQKGTINNK